jgi:hypothetical protein
VKLIEGAKMTNKATVTALVSFNDSSSDPTHDFADNVSLVFLEEECEEYSDTLVERRMKSKSVQEYFIMELWGFICEQGLQEKLDKYVAEREFDTLVSIDENGRTVSRVPREQEG